jgi:hypothetical protein
MSLTAAPSPVVFYEDRAPGEAAWLCCQGLVEVLPSRRPARHVPPDEGHVSPRTYVSGRRAVSVRAGLLRERPCREGDGRRHGAKRHRTDRPLGERSSGLRLRSGEVPDIVPDDLDRNRRDVRLLCGDRPGALPRRLHHRSAQDSLDADHSRAGAGCPRRVYRLRRLSCAPPKSPFQRRHPDGCHRSRCPPGGDCDDAVLRNSQGHVTETTIANLVVEKCGRLVTPPVACGLLPGLFREHLLEAGEIVEDVVTIEDLRRAPRVFAINSVRRWMPAVFQS